MMKLYEHFLKEKRCFNLLKVGITAREYKVVSIIKLHNKLKIYASTLVETLKISIKM